MNKFAKVLGAYDALVGKMENANSMSVRLATYKEIEDFQNSLLDKLVPMLKTKQDYLDALEILEVYPEFAEEAEYLTNCLYTNR